MKPKEALSGAERKAKQAEAKRKLGLIPRQVWARPEHWDLITQFVADLTARKQRR